MMLVEYKCKACRKSYTKFFNDGNEKLNLCGTCNFIVISAEHDPVLLIRLFDILVLEKEMAKLTTKARNKLPKSEFGEPGKKAYPMPDKSHAANAKARATQMVNKEKLSASEKSKIDAKANKIFDKGKKKAKKK